MGWKHLRLRLVPIILYQGYHGNNESLNSLISCNGVLGLTKCLWYVSVSKWHFVHMALCCDSEKSVSREVCVDILQHAWFALAFQILCQNHQSTMGPWILFFLHYSSKPISCCQHNYGFKCQGSIKDALYWWGAPCSYRKTIFESLSRDRK